LAALQRRLALRLDVISPGAPFPGWTRGLQAALDRLAIAALRLPRGTLAGPVLSRELGRALEFADYRAYVPGDDPKLVDWRAYNRLDRLYLKQYREERARTITILIDGSASLDWGDGDTHKGLYARRLAAALAWIALGRLERAEVFVLRRDSAERLPTVVGRAGAAGLFKALGNLHEDGPMDLSRAVQEALTKTSGNGPIFLLTDLLDADWQSALHAIAARNRGGVVLQLLAPDEYHPAFGDEVELEDSETGELRQTRFGPTEVSEYKTRLATLLDEVGDLSRRLGLRHVACDTAEPLADALLKRLPKAGVLR
jgi:uncharacterized protein (DUF58 family)